MTAYDIEQKRADQYREADRKLAATPWPPRKGALIHYASGWSHTSWSGTVHLTVDNHLVVEGIAGEGKWHIVHEEDWPHFRPGPLTLEGLARPPWREAG